MQFMTILIFTKQESMKYLCAVMNTYTNAAVPKHSFSLWLISSILLFGEAKTSSKTIYFNILLICFPNSA